MILPKDLEYLIEYENLFAGQFWGAEPDGTLVYTVGGKDYSLADLSENDVEALIERAKREKRDIFIEQLPLFITDPEAIY